MQRIQRYIDTKGFTLAEVLITLTVIGVIAALTIPALLQNINKQDLRTQWKAAYSICDQATKKALMENGGDFTNVFQSEADMLSKLKGYFNHTQECTSTTSPGNCWPSQFYLKNGNSSGWSGAYGIVLSNGMFVRFYQNTNGPTCTETGYYSTGECGAYEVDVNGFKGPNTIGEDIFWIHILPNGIKPGGVPGSQGGTQNCTTNGAGCSALYLMQ